MVFQVCICCWEQGSTGKALQCPPACGYILVCHLCLRHSTLLTLLCSGTDAGTSSQPEEGYSQPKNGNRRNSAEAQLSRGSNNSSSVLYPRTPLCASSAYLNNHTPLVIVEMHTWNLTLNIYKPCVDISALLGSSSQQKWFNTALTPRMICESLEQRSH